MSRMKVVDSPPGTTSPSSPSSCSALRTSTGFAPSLRSIAACSRKFPWRARTPTIIGTDSRFGYPARVQRGKEGLHAFALLWSCLRARAAYRLAGERVQARRWILDGDGQRLRLESRAVARRRVADRPEG